MREKNLKELIAELGLSHPAKKEYDELIKRFNQVSELVVKSIETTDIKDPYFKGMTNGLICAEAVLQGCEASYV